MEQFHNEREFRFPLRVYIEDTDAGGIVYYVNYLKYMERGRTELMRSLGYDKPAILDGGQLLVVHSAQVNYRKPARLDEALIATASFGKVTRTSVVFKQRILRPFAGLDAGEGSVMHKDEVLCDGEIKVACVNAGTMKPSAIPEQMRAAIDGHFQKQQ